MKAVPILEHNQRAIVDALQTANGSASAHSFTGYAEIAALAKEAEARLAALQLPLKDRVGATFIATSGFRVAKAYKNRRAGTTVTLTRRSNAWTLAAAERAWLFSEGGGTKQLKLSPMQDDSAVRRLRASYTVASAPSKQVPR